LEVNANPKREMGKSQTVARELEMGRGVVSDLSKRGRRMEWEENRIE
jgi:hypothetical protein